MSYLQEPSAEPPDGFLARVNILRLRTFPGKARLIRRNKILVTKIVIISTMQLIFPSIQILFQQCNNYFHQTNK